MQPSHCAICGASRFESFAHKNGCDLIRCTECGLVFQYPAPTTDDLGGLYDDTYKGASESYFTKVPQKMRRARGRIAQIRRAMSADPKRLRFLDVGCNGGFVVEAAREAGFAAFGVEPDGAAVAYAKRQYPNNTFIHGFLEKAEFGDLQFDVIYCSEVIEHAPDANAFVARLASLLSDGGLLYLTTPDISHWRRPRNLDRWDAFCPPAHCIYFSPANLTRLLARHGIDVTHRRLAFKPGIKVMARKRHVPAGSGF